MNKTDKPINLSNKKIVEYGIKKGLIENGGSAKEIAGIFKELNPNLGNHFQQIIKYNKKSKLKNFSLKGNVDGIDYKNPKEYLEKIKEKLIEVMNDENLDDELLKAKVIFLRKQREKKGRKEIKGILESGD
ncbi:MAG: hypothetical protein WC872_00415 [Candidatus Absconditabacterales bacterium]